MGDAALATTASTMLHLGLGSFHRAHQAVYVHRLREAGDRTWSIVGGNIRDDMAATLAALSEQGGAYTLETVSPAGERRYEKIRSICEVVPYDPHLTRLIDVGADAATPIISFTVTEAGYYLAADDTLDLSHAALRADVAGEAPLTIYGAVAAILRARMARSGAPVTLLNCDNLRHNGARFRGGLLEFLERRGERRVREWVATNTTCPSAMVDRITPRPSPDVDRRVSEATGEPERAGVMAESYIQWVIEDRFAAARPAWESVGVEMVATVQAHEEAKIRILNATHSGIAWAGTLRGLGYIHEGIAVDEIRRIAHDYVTDDVIPSLDAPGRASPFDLVRYRDVVLERFGNPWVRDTNQRVAMDGWSKIPGFVVPTLRECLARGASIASSAMLPALFFAFLERWHRGRLPYDYEDGVMEAARAHAIFEAPDALGAFCADGMLFGPLAGDPRLVAALRVASARVQRFAEA